jgi:hypothetical protein
MKALPILMLLFAATSCLAGDFCVVVCDDATKQASASGCPAPTFRTSVEIATDFRLIARGGAPTWPFGALSNGFFQFCSRAEHRAAMVAVADAIPVASPTRRRQLTDVACMVGPGDTLIAIDGALKRTDLASKQRHRLTAARATIRDCVHASPR